MLVTNQEPDTNSAFDWSPHVFARVHRIYGVLSLIGHQAKPWSTIVNFKP